MVPLINFKRIQLRKLNPYHVTGFQRRTDTLNQQTRSIQNEYST